MIDGRASEYQLLDLDVLERAETSEKVLRQI
jgi:hypothetical protein